MRITVGITGGSGSIYALALLKLLRSLNVETHLVVSTMGEKVTKHECGVSIEELKEYCDVFYENDNIGAAIASGSFKSDGMVIVPCSMKTLSSVANGYSETLLTRAADVCIKEQRRLLMVVREMPLSPIHLENMLKLSKMGVVIMPASPAFYTHPQDISDMVKFVAGRVLDQLKIEHEIMERWNGECD